MLMQNQLAIARLEHKQQMDNWQKQVLVLYRMACLYGLLLALLLSTSIHLRCVLE